ncbi:hypothetical protein C2U51_15345 [Enterobacteriaceae bacterium ENNIH1]|nr:hypothetical protein C2U51_15345 [Enterobacteriaceae bacterium ENNIH1]
MIVKHQNQNVPIEKNTLIGDEVLLDVMAISLKIKATISRGFFFDVVAMWTLILKIPFNQLIKRLTFPLMEGLTCNTVSTCD